MHILYMLVIGLIVGALAKFVMPGRDPGGIIITILIGIAGSMLAGFIGREMHWYSHGQPAGFLASIVGAIILLAAYRLIRTRM
ncbi:MAG: GlsB/YeaQ/YmgE family stress response membrane protein [Myxococcota bacterium]|nr:GlsB/YeaQ/YmgE family stress response membrane protein [Myxococcota bacterium]